jgi:hypothetical protein
MTFRQTVSSAPQAPRVFRRISRSRGSTARPAIRPPCRLGQGGAINRFGPRSLHQLRNSWPGDGRLGSPAAVRAGPGASPPSSFGWSATPTTRKARSVWSLRVEVAVVLTAVQDAPRADPGLVVQARWFPGQKGETACASSVWTDAGLLLRRR